MRILITSDVDPTHVIGGAERLLHEHCTRLAARGHRVVVLTRRADPSLPAESDCQGVRVVRHPITEGSAPAYVASAIREGKRAFQRLNSEAAFDLINAHQPLAALSVLAARESRRLPVFYTYLSPWGDEYRTRCDEALSGSRPGPLHSLARWVNVSARVTMERVALRRSQRIMVLSEFSASQLRDIHGIREERVTVIPGGVDAERFRPAPNRAALRRELGMGPGPALLTVRNLVPRMGLEALLTAMRTVVDRHPATRLYLGGKGPLAESLRRQAEALMLSNNVTFLGFIPEERLPDYYAAADLFVLPSKCLEGFGLVTVESLACGTPVVGTPVGGTQEILRDLGEPGALFDDVTPGALADRLLEQIPTLRGNSNSRARCRLYAEGRYSWSAIIPQVEKEMESVALRFARSTTANVSARQASA